VFAYHNASSAATLNLWPAAGASACVCVQEALPFGQGSGLIHYKETGEKVGFKPNRCSPQPRGDLLVQKNPTCDLRTYEGGLSTCHHHWKLLDADQEIPWSDKPLVYFKKFRVYFQEAPDISKYTEIHRSDWGIAADGDHAEYDVPQTAANAGNPQCTAGGSGAGCKLGTHTITGTWTPLPAAPKGKGMHIVAAHFHCHAPTCLRVELWNNNTGELLCRQEPIYGGTGSKFTGSRYDESGYIATPPCLWGKPEHGLEAPPLASGMRIRVVAVTNSTYGHHGEMALPEMSYAPM